jgi:hypothetical protein
MIFAIFTHTWLVYRRWAYLSCYPSLKYSRKGRSVWKVASPVFLGNGHACLSGKWPGVSVWGGPACLFGKCPAGLPGKWPGVSIWELAQPAYLEGGPAFLSGKWPGLSIWEVARPVYVRSRPAQQTRLWCYILEWQEPGYKLYVLAHNDPQWHLYWGCATRLFTE